MGTTEWRLILTHPMYPAFGEQYTEWTDDPHKVRDSIFVATDAGCNVMVESRQCYFESYDADTFFTDNFPEVPR